MIRRIADRWIVWLIAVAFLWTLVVQPAAVQLGKDFESRYHSTSAQSTP
jgi:hypothetical protein